MRAKVTYSQDPNTHAVSEMLSSNGQWLVTVHEGRITKMSKVPKAEPVERIINKRARRGALPRGELV